MTKYVSLASVDSYTAARPCPVFKAGTSVCDVLFQGRNAKLAASRVRQDRPIEPIIGAMSNDLDFQKFKKGVAEGAMASPELAENVDDAGRCYGTGVRSNWWGLLHMNGFPMKNGTWPLASNQAKRADDKYQLTNTWQEPWHIVAFDTLVEIFFTSLSPVPMKVRKGSSTVIPFFTRDPGERVELAVRALADAEPAGKLIAAGNYKEAFLNYQFGGANYVVYRSQSTDKIEFVDGIFVPKPRLVADMKYAITGGDPKGGGRLYESSKALDDVDFPVVKGFARERLRTAMGGSFQLNVSLMPVMQAVRASLYQRFPFSFHHTTRMDKHAKVSKYDTAIAVDVSDHDTLWPAELYLPRIEAVLLDLGFPTWWVALLMVSFRLPIYVGAPAVGEGQTLLGDWRNPAMSVGMPSGQAGTDVFGTLGMSFIYFVIQVQHTAPHLIKQLKNRVMARPLIEAWLRGELDFGCMSKTDDAMLLWRGQLARAGEKVRSDLQKDVPVSPYMKISYEHGGAFLGDILLYGADMSLKNAIFTGNILSFANNMLCPEYGIQSQIKDRTRVKRGFPGLAYRSASDVYGACPGYEAILDVMEKEWRAYRGGSFHAFRVKWCEDDEKALIEAMRSRALSFNLHDLSRIDMEVLANPNTLQYKYLPEDVNPSVVALSMYQVGLEVVEPYFNSVVPPRCR